jgi:hypothetical protein
VIIEHISDQELQELIEELLEIIKQHGTNSEQVTEFKVAHSDKGEEFQFMVELVNGLRHELEEASESAQELKEQE